MRLLITGGAGCLGSNLAEHYLAAGHDVLTIDNYVTGHRLSLPDGHPNLTIIDGSILDENLLRQVFSDFSPTHVIHAAASYRDPDDWVTDSQVNAEGTIRVIRAAEAAGVNRFVNFHTALGYGRPDVVPIPITAPARPFTSYGVSKQAGENYVAMSSLSWVSMRLANVTGPRLAIGPIPTFYTRLKANKPCFCSRTVRDFIDMADFLALVDKALEEGAPIGVFNVSTGTGHTIRDIFRLVSAHVGRDPDADVPEVEPGPDDVAKVVLDPSETIRAFGWKPQYRFDEIIGRILSWYDIHGVTAIWSHLKAPEIQKEGTIN